MKIINKQLDILNKLFIIIFLLLLYLISKYNFLLFHSISEIFSICIAFTIFLLIWNSWEFLENEYLKFIGIAYFFIAAIDLLHTLAYKGMGVFPNRGANLATQLWILGRYTETLSILCGFILFNKKKEYNPKIYFLLFTVIVSIPLLAIFHWKVFPVCYVENLGLTKFKKQSEYIISIIFILSLFILHKNKKRFNVIVYKFIFISIVCAIIAEAFFTVYISVYDISNLAGHYFKIISFYFIYKAIIEKSIKDPQQLIFKELMLKKDKIKEENKILEKKTRVDGLTKLFNHKYIYERLEKEIETQKRYKKDLSIIMIDIDFFKILNDTFGHTKGDEILVALSNIIQNTIRTIDIPSRYGGEEFLIILPQCDIHDCFLVADRIRKKVENYLTESNLKFTISAGVSQYENGDATFFVDIADKNLYKAKKTGRNKVAI